MHCFWEESYHESARVLSSAMAISEHPSDDEACFLAYAAALARDRKVVREVLGSRSGSRWEILSGCLEAWADGNYGGVIQLVAQGLGPDGAGGDHDMCHMWARLTQARSYMRVGDANGAYHVLLSQVIPVVSDPGNKSQWHLDLLGVVELHVSIVAAEISEEAGDREGAMAFARVACNYMESVEFLSWNGLERKMQKIAEPGSGKGPTSRVGE
jgi:hypothetical protein